MSQDSRQLNIWCPNGQNEQVEEIANHGDFDSKSDAGHALLERGIESYRQDHRSYPGMGLITDGLMISAVAAVIVAPTALAIGGAAAHRSVLVMAVAILVFGTAHAIGSMYATLQGE